MRAIYAVPVGFAAMAALLVLSQPAPPSPLEYMIAGTLSTTGALVAGFTVYARTRLQRTSNRPTAPSRIPPKTARSS